MKKIIVVIIVVILVILGIYFITKGSSQNVALNQNQNTSTGGVTPTDQTPAVATSSKDRTVIGKSADGRDLIAYHYGNGTSTELLFVGGIHGGYEWNTALVAYQLMDYLKANPSFIPANEKVTVVPALNADGLAKVLNIDGGPFTAADVPASVDTVPGRFNGNGVDLNRNFDCDWQASGKWQNKTVSGGDSAFSEPESQAIKNYVETNHPTAVVVWYSAAGGVFASNCHSGVLSETNKLTKIFSAGSGYPAYESFNFYEITGDMVNWLAKINVPAISVLLTNHTDTEWSKNQAGIQALLKYYSK